jgi:hypothetical protein
MMAAQAQRSTPSNLQAIVWFVVVNESTKSVIWNAAKRLTCTREDLYDHREYTKWDHGYHAILGTMNGASTMRMLLDRKAQTGYRTVERVVVLGDKQLKLDKPENSSFVLLLSSRRTTPTKIPEPLSTTRRAIPLESILQDLYTS